VEGGGPLGFQIYQETGLTPSAANRPVAEPRGFQIYRETGLTPASATRPAAVINQGFPRQSWLQTSDDNDKENQCVSTAAAVRPPPEEPMAVDFVNMLTIFFCYDSGVDIGIAVLRVQADDCSSMIC